MVKSGVSDRYLNMIWEALKAGDPDLVTHYVKGGVNINEVYNDGSTLLMRAASEGCGRLVEKLQEAGADISAADDGGQNALHKATIAGRI